MVLAECAIIATDVAEVIGSAIALNILLKIPLPAGVVITIIDVLFVLMAYRADTSLMKFVKILNMPWVHWLWLLLFVLPLNCHKFMLVQEIFSVVCSFETNV